MPPGPEEYRAPTSAWSTFQGSRPLIHYAALRELVSIADVLRHLNWTPTERHGDQLRGPCPIHGSERPQSRSLAVNLAKNAFKCFAPDERCGASGNQLDLAAAVWRLPIYDAATRLAGELGVPLPLRDTEKRNPSETPRN